MTVLTPRATVATLLAGYRPELHSSARMYRTAGTVADLLDRGQVQDVGEPRSRRFAPQAASGFS